jgi:hypothetical protein
VFRLGGKTGFWRGLREFLEECERVFEPFYESRRAPPGGKGSRAEAPNGAKDLEVTSGETRYRSRPGEALREREASLLSLCASRRFANETGVFEAQRLPPPMLPP